ncbi:MAG: 2,3,4,5-tetrahydropyridine-2,6-dicarboxylate N-succinyltransferase [Gammaproteobacteria bacterium]|nr:2,3,4,5-tetrahydropyridine-2,6-dicarboxylate N-succinyltransferase [Gammaproteobacteria bacterium]
MEQCYAYGIGIATKNSRGEIIEVYYPSPVLKPSIECTSELIAAVGQSGTHTLNEYQLSDLRSSDLTELTSVLDAFSDTKSPLVLCLLNKNEAPQDVASVFLKLHLLSHRLVRPHETVLDGMFGVLKNLAWTSEGAIDLDDLPARQLKARCKGTTLSVDCVDKFPKMCDYVVPAGVRIADTARVRLGAYIGEGTTVMHEGFVNFNAGTEGPAMIEGRISAGVWVAKHSDLGGGSSTMGTLSGGGNIVISVGENCLIGANAGTGIPLGDRCTIESGLYITAGTKVSILDDDNQLVRVAKASVLANRSDLLFRRNSQSGAVECKTNQTAVALNEQLHAN